MTLLRFLRNPPRNAVVLLASLTLQLGACATPPSEPAARAEFDRTNDPFEPLNRKVFGFNLFFDRILLRPVAVTYQAAIPEAGRTAIHNFLDNLLQPVVFANNVLQGQFQRANDVAGRFLLNSTFGIGGTIDLATKTGLEKQTGDFGQTLYSWGVPDGPYLVLPVLGPSNPRDAVGLGVDAAANPYGWAIKGQAITTAGWIRYGISGIDQRSRNIDTLDELQRSSIDFYATLRSVYRQHRASDLRHGEPAPMPDLDTLNEVPTGATEMSQAAPR